MSDERRRRLYFPLRLSEAVRREAHEMAHDDCLSLNQFISVAVVEKICRMEEANRRNQAVKAHTIGPWDKSNVARQ
jgi:hypothetical protein